jgi:hypothetical protein
MFGADDVAGGTRSRGAETGTTGGGDGLGDSTATPPAKRGRASAPSSSEHEGAIPPLVDA